MLVLTLLCTLWQPYTEPDWFLQQHRADQQERRTLTQLRYQLAQSDGLQPLLRRQQQRIYIRDYVIRTAQFNTKESCHAR